MTIQDNPGLQKDLNQNSSIQTVYERRYRTSKYFLEDQLRCSDAVQDFRTIKSLILRSQAFSLRHAFNFAPQSIPIPVEVPKQR